jgi:putative SOS response-associated peptidase YedK
MCGRFTATFVDPQRIAQRFGVGGSAIPAETLGRYNVCPTEQVLAVCGPEESRAARDLRWGLVPPWARKLRAGPEPINARVESLLGKRLFAPLLERADRRCLVIADGWYEWLRPERPRGERVPFRYTVDGGAPFAFAGLWHERRVDGERLASVTVLTTDANAVCSPVHDRMPCVLESAEAEAAWLSPDVDAQAALELLTVLAAARTSAAPANPAVNKAGVEGAELLTVPPAPAEPVQLQLG